MDCPRPRQPLRPVGIHRRWPGLFKPAQGSIERHRYRGRAIPLHGPHQPASTSPRRESWRARCRELARRVRRSGKGKGPPERAETRPSRLLRRPPPSVTSGSPRTPRAAVVATAREPGRHPHRAHHRNQGRRLAPHPRRGPATTPISPTPSTCTAWHDNPTPAITPERWVCPTSKPLSQIPRGSDIQKALTPQSICQSMSLSKIP